TLEAQQELLRIASESLRGVRAVKASTGERETAARFHLKNKDAMHQEMRAAGFVDTRLLNFPQPLYPSGWWSATQALKNPGQQPRYAEIDSAALESRYFTADICRAAQALPPFVAEALAS
ncbi:MAG: hypothetical protein R3268_11965, partial [Acidiferrobacterales bacterium]|nr:hypothetical protein [Acidiferrobacterales bacterium]